jgi:hypothetical protein
MVLAKVASLSVTYYRGRTIKVPGRVENQASDRILSIVTPLKAIENGFRPSGRVAAELENRAAARVAIFASVAACPARGATA